MRLLLRPVSSGSGPSIGHGRLDHRIATILDDNDGCTILYYYVGQPTIIITLA